MENNVGYSWRQAHRDTLGEVLWYLGMCFGEIEPKLGMFERESLKELAHSPMRAEHCSSVTDKRSSWYRGLNSVELDHATDEEICLCLEHAGLDGDSSGKTKSEGARFLVGTILRVLQDNHRQVGNHTRLLECLGEVYGSDEPFTGDLRTLVETFVEAVPWIDFSIILRTSANAKTPMFTTAPPTKSARRSGMDLFSEIRGQTISPATQSWQDLQKNLAAFPRFESLFRRVRQLNCSVFEKYEHYSLIAALFPGEDQHELAVFFIRDTPAHDTDSNSVRIFSSLAEHFARSKRNETLLRRALPVRAQSPENRRTVWAGSLAHPIIDKLLRSSASGRADVRLTVLDAMEQLCQEYRNHVRDEHLLRVLSRFEDTERLLLEIPLYRDHFLHSFLVFLCGYEILRGMPDATKRLPVTFTNAYDPEGPLWSLEEVEAAWLLTALFHDISYPISHIESWANDLAKGLTRTGTLGAGRFVSLDKDALLAASRQSLAAVGTVLANASRRNGHDVDCEVMFNLLESNLLSFGDHGVLSSAFLLNSTDLEAPGSILLGAASAIAIHENLLHLPDERQELSECENLMAFKQQLISLRKSRNHKPRNAIRFETHPLGALLVYCDNLQEWGRAESHGGLPPADAFLEELKVSKHGVRAKTRIEIHDHEQRHRIETERYQVKLLLNKSSFQFHSSTRLKDEPMI